MKVSLRWPFLFIKSRIKCHQRSIDSEGYSHCCLYLPNIFKEVIIDVEISNEQSDSRVYIHLSRLTKSDPLSVWTKLEVFAKYSNTPIILVLREFLNSRSLDVELEKLGIKYYKIDKYNYSILLPTREIASKYRSRVSATPNNI